MHLCKCASILPLHGDEGEHTLYDEKLFIYFLNAFIICGDRVFSPCRFHLKKTDARRDGKRELGVQTTTHFFGFALDLGLIALC